jgi:hypothetical protein
MFFKGIKDNYAAGIARIYALLESVMGLSAECKKDLAVAVPLAVIRHPFFMACIMDGFHLRRKTAGDYTPAFRRCHYMQHVFCVDAVLHELILARIAKR